MCSVAALLGVEDVGAVGASRVCTLNSCLKRPVS